MIKVQNLEKEYGKAPNVVHALDGVSFSVEAGEFIAVIGESGSGKSTLFHMLGGLDRPTNGEVYIDGQKLSDMSDEACTLFRRRQVGFVFQQYNLIPTLNVYDNIVLPVELDNKPVDEAFVSEIIELLGLKEKINSLPNQLSGGQQQRVAVARALVTKPSIVLADEPTGNLDSKTSREVLDVFKMTSKQFHQTMMMITHNEQIAALADRTIRLQDGKIIV